MSEVENSLWMRSAMNVTPVFQIEIEPWGAASILIKVIDGVYICSYSVRSGEHRCKTERAFVYDSQFKTLHQSKWYEDLIDNRTYAPICVLE